MRSPGSTAGGVLPEPSPGHGPAAAPAPDLPSPGTRLPGLSLLTARNAIGAAFIAGHLVAAYLSLRSFPGTWSWGELLVNYQGGFNKRGLLGATAFLLRHAVRPQHFLTALLLATYVLVTVWFVFRERMTARLSGLLFLFSPTGWLWPFLVTWAYGRKDVFVVAAAALSLSLARGAHRTATLCIATMAVFAVAGLVVEVAWFYCPIVLAGILWRRRDDPTPRRLGLAALGGAYCLACLLATLILPRVDTAAIARSWAPIPIADGGSSALCCLNLPLAEALDIGLEMGRVLGGGYALAALFGAVPIVLLLLDGTGRRPDAPSAALMVAAVAFSAAPLMVAADWGRYIYLSLTVTFCALWIATRGAAPTGARVLTPANVLLVGLYASLWQTTHFQILENSAFVPGILFRMLGESFMPPGVD